MLLLGEEEEQEVSYTLPTSQNSTVRREALILDERQREQQLRTTLDQYVATEWQRVLIRVGIAPVLVLHAVDDLILRVAHHARGAARAQAARSSKPRTELKPPAK